MWHVIFHKMCEVCYICFLSFWRKRKRLCFFVLIEPDIINLLLLDTQSQHHLVIEVWFSKICFHQTFFLHILTIAS